MTHVAVLMGGLSSERDVSLNSGKAVANALRERNYQVTEVDVDFDIASRLKELKPDVAFNALHGTYGEDGCIQGVLEFLRIPYTHAGVMSSAVAMHKVLAKKLFATAGIPCAEGVVLTREEILQKDVMERPYVIKPINNGSSVGVLIVDKHCRLDTADASFPEGRHFLVEKYIAGKELTVGVLDAEVLGIIEIRPKQGFYDYRNKYTSGMTEYLMPPEVPGAVQQQAGDYALEAHKVLECRGITRSDFRYDTNTGKLYILEVNTHPGMTATSLVPKMAKNKGMEFADFVVALLKRASLDNR